MRHLMLFALALAAGAPVPARAQPAPGAPEADLAPLSDEFDGPASLAGWTRFDRAEGWPDHVRRLDVGVETPGTLRLEPWTSGWYNDFHAPFLFREVSGDFDVVARVRVTGTQTELPRAPWSLGGLMVREPGGGGGPQGWRPRHENWLFLTTGVADRLDQPLLESKSTVNGRSNLKLRPVSPGWVEMRIVRVGPSFVLLSRHDGEAWTVRERFYRADLPRTVQVGLTAYTDWWTARPLHDDPLRFNTTVIRDGRPDAVLHVDWIRFARPPRHPALHPATLTDYATPDAAVLEALAG